MRHSWRWFGPSDPVTLAEIRQAGATDIVSALHHVPNGEIWTVEEIEDRRALIEAAGLRWSVVESVPLREEIKRGTANRDTYIELGLALPDGSLALLYEHRAFVAFDVFILERPGAAEDYAADEVTTAWEYFVPATRSSDG
jgi:mannonate dehydratase